MKNINDRIQYLITSKGLNKRSFARKIGVDSTKIQNIVKGRNVGTKDAPEYKKNPPSYDIIIRILTTFNDIDAYWLLFDDYKKLNVCKKEVRRNISTTDRQIEQKEDTKVNELQTQINKLEEQNTLLIEEKNKLYKILDQLSAKK